MPRHRPRRSGCRRVAQVVDLVVTDRGAQRVEILCHIVGSDVGRKSSPSCRRSAPRTPWSSSRSARHPPGCSPPADRRATDRCRHRVAPQRRCGGTHATRIEANQVKALADLLRQPSTRLAAASIPDSPGPPGLMISEPILSPVAGESDQRQVRLGGVGFVVVNRNGDLAALRAGRDRQRLAAPPPAGRQWPLRHRLPDLRVGQNGSAGHHGAAPGAGGEQAGHGRKHHRGAQRSGR